MQPAEAHNNSEFLETYEVKKTVEDITRDSLTCSLNLLCCEPAVLKGLDAERTEGELVSSLGHSLHTVLLFPSEFGSFWL